MKSKQLSEDDLKYIQLSLLHLGAVKWTRSAVRLKRAIEYAVSRFVFSEETVGCLYNTLAEQDGCSYGVIEHSLRYAINNLWDCDPRNCSKLFLRSTEVEPCPGVSQFLYLYTAAFQRGVIKEYVDSMHDYNDLIDNNEQSEIKELIDRMSKIEILK